MKITSMKEEELHTFIKNPNNKESNILEYKLKPNFNEIKNFFVERKFLIKIGKVDYFYSTLLLLNLSFLYYRQKHCYILPYSFSLKIINLYISSLYMKTVKKMVKNR